MQWALRVAFLFSKENQGEVRSSLQFILVLKICFVFPGKKCHRYFKDILQSVCFLVSQRGKDGGKKQWERGDSVGDGKTSWNWVDFRDHLFSLPQSLNDWFSSFLFLQILLQEFLQVWNQNSGIEHQNILMFLIQKTLDLIALHWYAQNPKPYVSFGGMMNTHVEGW